MKQYSVIIVGASEEQRALLQMQVEATMAAQTVQMHSTYPVDVTDLTLRAIQDAAPEIILVDIPHNTPEPAIRAIEVLQNRLPEVTVFAVGDAGQSQVIIAAIRAGAREFLERPTSSESLMEAFGRLASAQRRSQSAEQRGKIITIINSKGGCGATTIAVNTAMALQKLVGAVAIVDLVPQGHVALHLNARPSFTIADALMNLQRLDGALLETYMVRCGQGLELLAGATEPYPDECSEDLPRLLDILSVSYKYVVVDASSRLDNTTRAVCNLSDSVLIVANTEVASMWSAAKTRQYLAANDDDTKLKLVMNRFRKVPGLSETEIESVTQAKVLARIPNQYAEVDEGISRGIPVVLKGNSELARAFMSLGEAISGGASAQPSEAKAPRVRTLGNIVGGLIQRAPEESEPTQSSIFGVSSSQLRADAEKENQSGAVQDRGNERPLARPVPVKRESAPPAHSPQVVEIASDVSYDEEIQAEVSSNPSTAIVGSEAGGAFAGSDVDTVVEAVMAPSDSGNSGPATTLPQSDSSPVWKKFAIPAALVLIVAVILGAWMVRRGTARSGDRSGASPSPVMNGNPVGAQGPGQALLQAASGSTEAKPQAISESNESSTSAREASAQTGKSADRRVAMILRSPGGLPRQVEQPSVAPPVIAGGGSSPLPLFLPTKASNVLLRPAAQTTASEPQAVKRVMPTYPPAAERLGVAGKVTLQAQVRKDGTVGQVTALSGPVLLRSSAIAALRQWQYKPGTRNGAAVDSNITVEMNFTK